jgi:hypothetical protein
MAYEWKFIRVRKEDWEKLEKIRKEKEKREKKPVWIYEVIQDILETQKEVKQ